MLPKPDSISKGKQSLLTIVCATVPTSLYTPVFHPALLVPCSSALNLAIRVSQQTWALHTVTVPVYRWKLPTNNWIFHQINREIQILKWKIKRNIWDRRNFAQSHLICAPFRRQLCLCVSRPVIWGREVLRASGPTASDQMPYPGEGVRRARQEGAGS